MRRAPIAFAAVAVVFAAQPIMAQEFSPGPFEGAPGAASSSRFR